MSVKIVKIKGELLENSITLVNIIRYLSIFILIDKLVIWFRFKLISMMLILYCRKEEHIKLISKDIILNIIAVVLRVMLIAPPLGLKDPPIPRSKRLSDNPTKRQEL